MRISLRSVLVSAGLIAATGAVSGSAFAGGPTVQVLLLREHTTGTPGIINPALNAVVGVAAQLNGWDSASSGNYFPKRGSAVQQWIKDKDPHYAILSLAAFLEMRKPQNLDPVGLAVATTGGGEQYHVVSTKQATFADCKGKPLHTDHDDVVFNDKIVFDGAAKMSDFTVTVTKRFGEAGDNAVTGTADCALVDDAQYAQIKNAPNLKSLWQSAQLPPMVVAAFPSAPAAEKATFQQNLNQICTTSPQACSNANIKSLSSAPASTFQTVIGKYP